MYVLYSFYVVAMVFVLYGCRWLLVCFWLVALVFWVVAIVFVLDGF